MDPQVISNMKEYIAGSGNPTTVVKLLTENYKGLCNTEYNCKCNETKQLESTKCRISSNEQSHGVLDANGWNQIM